MRILLAEDDAMLGDGIARSLRENAHAVDWVRDGASALDHGAPPNTNWCCSILGCHARMDWRCYATVARQASKATCLS